MSHHKTRGYTFPQSVPPSIKTHALTACFSYIPCRDQAVYHIPLPPLLYRIYQRKAPKAQDYKHTDLHLSLSDTLHLDPLHTSVYVRVQVFAIYWYSTSHTAMLFPENPHPLHFPDSPVKKAVCSSPLVFYQGPPKVKKVSHRMYLLSCLTYRI